jgi:hypothetical protein
MTQKKMRNKFAHNLHKQLGLKFVEAHKVASRVGKLVYLDNVDDAYKALRELVLDHWYCLSDLAPLVGVTVEDLDWYECNQYDDEY